MEALLVGAFAGYLVWVFFSSYRSEVFKNLNPELKELDTLRKEKMMAESAERAAKIMRQQFKDEFEQARFHAAVQAAATQQAQAARQPRPTFTAQPQPQPQETFSWRQQKAAAARNQQQGASYQEEPVVVPNDEVSESFEPALQPAEYNRDQDFPDQQQL